MPCAVEREMGEVVRLLLEKDLFVLVDSARSMLQSISNDFKVWEAFSVLLSGEN